MSHHYRNDLKAEVGKNIALNINHEIDKKYFKAEFVNKMFIIKYQIFYFFSDSAKPKTKSDFCISEPMLFRGPL